MPFLPKEVSSIETKERPISASLLETNDIVSCSKRTGLPCNRAFFFVNPAAFTADTRSCLETDTPVASNSRCRVQRREAMGLQAIMFLIP